MSILKPVIKRFLPQNFLERRDTRKWYESQLSQVPSVAQGIDSVIKRWNVSSPPEITDNPVFIFASGWRSGSTLLQRLVNSDGKILLWGEPFANCNLIPSLADTLKAFSDRYPSHSHFLDSDHFNRNSADLSQRWTANLYPDTANLIQAHRQFFHTLYQQPALTKGYQRWGLKEVRLSIDHATYLQWLFPQAQFLFLYRNPYKAYRSCRNWTNLYMRWPDQSVYTPEQFGNYWQTMTSGYLQNYQQVKGKLIKYEELASGNFLLEDLANYLQLNLDKNVLAKRIGGQKKTQSIPQGELKRLQKAVEPLASQLGYLPEE